MRLISLALAALLGLGFAALPNSAVAKNQRDKYGYLAPYFGSDIDDRHRFRTERRLPYAKGARPAPASRLDSYSYQYSRDGYQYAR
jgi:hypothetical protein